MSHDYVSCSAGNRGSTFAAFQTEAGAVEWLKTRLGSEERRQNQIPPPQVEDASAIPTRASQGFASSADAAPKAAFARSARIDGRPRSDGFRPRKETCSESRRKRALWYSGRCTDRWRPSARRPRAPRRLHSASGTRRRARISTPRPDSQALQDRFQPAVELGGEESSRALRGRTEKPTAGASPMSGAFGTRNWRAPAACRVSRFVANRKSAACTMARLVAAARIHRKRLQRVAQIVSAREHDIARCGGPCPRKSLTKRPTCVERSKGPRAGRARRPRHSWKTTAE